MIRRYAPIAEKSYPKQQDSAANAEQAKQSETYGASPKWANQPPNKATSLRCGGGWINYAIQTDGNIIPCPTMWGMKNYYLGHIRDADPLELRKMFVGEPCTSCGIYGVCGGRCLYANITRRWSEDAYSSVCNAVRELTKALKMEIPRIKRLVKSGAISLIGFDFLKYNGCEIIP